MSLQNTDYDQEPIEQALRQGEGDAYWSSPWACREVVGKPDARNPPVRFDERGRETERLAKPQAAAPFLDSTGSLFRLRVSHHLGPATFPAPASSNAACGFP